MHAEKHTNWFDKLVYRCAGSRYAKMEKRLNLGYALSVLFWALCTELSDFLIERALATGIWAWLTVLVTIAAGAWAIYRYYRLYTGVDEMTRKLLGNALSISLGIVVFIMMVFISLKDMGVWQPPVAILFASIIAMYTVVPPLLVARMKT